MGAILIQSITTHQGVGRNLNNIIKIITMPIKAICKTCSTTLNIKFEYHSLIYVERYYMKHYAHSQEFSSRKHMIISLYFKNMKNNQDVYKLRTKKSMWQEFGQKGIMQIDYSIVH